MNYLSCFSGIEAATAAWHDLGWNPVAFAEIEPFPSAVLAHRFPHVPNLGDITKYQEWNLGRSIDLMVGGSPCQAFSVAGLRKGLADPRGNLALVYLGIADHFRPRWIVWENVPGVLSSNRGRDFGAFLGALGELGYGFSYRVLDAQFFGVAQRRRRVFVVGYLGDWRPAAAVLFEPESVRGYPAPRRKTGENITTVAGTLAASGGGMNRPAGNANELDFLVPTAFGGNNQAGEIDIATAANAKGGSGRMDFESETFLPVLMDQGGSVMTVEEDMVGTLRRETKGHEPVIPVYPINTQMALRGAETSNTSREGIGVGAEGDPAFTLQAAHSHAVATPRAARRLTPRECERLQGFPDDWTLIPWRGKSADQCPDGPRYKAIGNSMAVPVMAWIGKRIQMVEEATA